MPTANESGAIANNVVLSEADDQTSELNESDQYRYATGTIISIPGAMP